MFATRLKKTLAPYLLGAFLASISLPSISNASTQEIKVKDYFGEQTFKLPIHKMIYLGSYAEVPAMLGTWDKVVGLSRYGFRIDINQVTAKNLNSIQSIGGDHLSALNTEELKKLAPDVVVTFVGNPKAIEYAKKFHISFLSFQEQSIEEAINNIKTQASILQIDASKKFAKMQETLNFVKERLRNVKRKKGIEFFHKINMVSGHHAISSDILEKGGIDNFGLKYVKFGRAEINMEKIVKENPEIIFIWWVSALKPEDVLNNPQFSTIKAVKNKQVYKLPTMDIGGPRAPLISLFIATKAYPEAFKGVDINEIVKDYYKVVFDLDEKEVQKFLWE
ncbi:ABC transporter substrate-binding protein [Helicobacter cetorum]|uniref:ABC transporter substrate-binding protein n=1 Tax=Helicobacter cetorum TaxID=138563 RepID=UPI000CF0A877|nr:ABC transporter substrate-binding protein [Helicobacter cetorum]